MILKCFLNSLNHHSSIACSSSSCSSLQVLPGISTMSLWNRTYGKSPESSMYTVFTSGHYTMSKTAIAAHLALGKDHSPLTHSLPPEHRTRQYQSRCTEQRLCRCWRRSTILPVSHHSPGRRLWDRYGGLQAMQQWWFNELRKHFKIITWTLKPYNNFIIMTECIT